MCALDRLLRHRWQFLVRARGLAPLLTCALLLAGCTTAPQIENSLAELAAQGQVGAQYEIGMRYYRAWDASFGNRALLDEATRWFALAAQQGDARAHYRMARLSADHRQSFEWLQLPAQQGVAEAQHDLGVHYAQAWGTPQDLVLAYKWIALAFAGGVPDPIGKLADLDWLVLNGRMTPEQIAEGQRLAAEHSTRYGISRPIGLLE